MNDTPAPKYMPNQLLHYRYGNRGHGISTIKSASFIPYKGWTYVVENPMDPKETLYVPEKDVIEDT